MRWACGLLLLATFTAQATVEVTAAADPPTVAVGDSTSYTIEVVADVSQRDPRPTVQVDTPVIGEGLVSWSARYEGLRWVEGRFQYRCSWTLLADTPGPAVIPPVRVAILMPDGRTDVHLTPEVRVTVTPAGSDRPARSAPLDAAGDPPAPEEPGAPGRWLFVLLGGTIVLSSLAALGWLRNHETATAAKDPSAPEAALRQALDAAEAKTGEAFWVALASALYTYTAAVGDHHGEGLTSAEALAILKQQHTSPALVAATAAALRQADGVRYAREPASAAGAVSRLAELRAALAAEGKDA